MDLHYHKCPKCKFVWKHDGDTTPWPPGFHDCPRCGMGDLRWRYRPEPEERKRADRNFRCRARRAGSDREKLI